MFQAIEAEIDINGNVKLLEKLILKNTKKALVIILDNLDDDVENKHETALLSESVLARDWNRPEEDEAWAHFQ